MKKALKRDGSPEAITTEVACWVHSRRKVFDLHKRVPTPLTTNILERIGALYAVEAEERGHFLRTADTQLLRLLCDIQVTSLLLNPVAWANFGTWLIGHQPAAQASVR